MVFDTGLCVYTRRELNLSYLLIYDKQLNNYVKIT